MSLEKVDSGCPASRGPSVSLPQDNSHSADVVDGALGPLCKAALSTSYGSVVATRSRSLRPTLSTVIPSHSRSDMFRGMVTIASAMPSSLVVCTAVRHGLKVKISEPSHASFDASHTEGRPGLTHNLPMLLLWLFQQHSHKATERTRQKTLPLPLPPLTYA